MLNPSYIDGTIVPSMYDGLDSGPEHGKLDKETSVLKGLGYFLTGGDNKKDCHGIFCDGIESSKKPNVLEGVLRVAIICEKVLPLSYQVSINTPCLSCSAMRIGL